MRSSFLVKIFCSLLLLTHSGLVFGWDLKDIVNGVSEIRETECSKITSENEEQCEQLEVNLKLLNSKEQHEFLTKLVDSYGGVPCKDRTEELARVREVVKSWFTASRAAQIYDPISVLDAIFCIEKGRPSWEQKCLQNPKQDYLAVWDKPDEQCTVRVPAQKIPDKDTNSDKSDSPDKKSGPDKVLKIDVMLNEGCKNVWLNIFQGQGKFKIAIRQYEYKSWKDMIYFRWRKLNSALKAEERAMVEEGFRQELRFGKRTENHHFIGIPEFHVKYDPKEPIEKSVMWVEAFDGELGQNDQPLAPMAEGGWQQVTSQLNAGLVLIHDMGYLHQDLKPPNILISRRNDPKRPPKAAYTDFGFSLDLRTLCEKNFPNMPERISAGTPMNEAPEQFTREFSKWEGMDCAEIIKMGQKTDIFSHALNIYRLKHEGKILPWELDKTITNIKQLSVAQKRHLRELIESLVKGDATDRLLAEALDYDRTPRPTMIEFQDRFDSITKEQLKESIPKLRTDIDFGNVREALTTHRASLKEEFVAYVETSPASGLFEIKLAYLDEHSHLVITPLSANPFVPVEVARMIEEFEKKTGLKQFVGEAVSHKSQGPPRQNIPPPLPEEVQIAPSGIVNKPAAVQSRKKTNVLTPAFAVKGDRTEDSSSFQPGFHSGVDPKIDPRIDSKIDSKIDPRTEHPAMEHPIIENPYFYFGELSTSMAGAIL